MEKGQISSGLIIGWGVALAIALVGGFFTQNNITNTEIEVVRTAGEAKIASLQVDITNIRINTALICQKLSIKCRE